MLDGGSEDATAAQLRQMLREKNEKISILTAEFDAHRADFRSTLDSLEMASTETERVYEEQKRDLLAQIQELQGEIGAGAFGAGGSKEDFEGVARQLKSLEELVAELEEGLEESRRGEAEARGEVEFLRGEVERGRSELKREREKAAAVVNGGSSGGSPKEFDAKDDEIRGLKAIIHSLSNTGGGDATTTLGEDATTLRRQLEDKFSENLSRQMRELEAEVNRQAEQISRSFPEVAELFG